MPCRLPEHKQFSPALARICLGLRHRSNSPQDHGNFSNHHLHRARGAGQATARRCLQWLRRVLFARALPARRADFQAAQRQLRCAVLERIGVGLPLRCDGPSFAGFGKCAARGTALACPLACQAIGGGGAALDCCIARMRQHFGA